MVNPAGLKLMGSWINSNLPSELKIGMRTDETLPPGTIEAWQDGRLIGRIEHLGVPDPPDDPGPGLPGCDCPKGGRGHLRHVAHDWWQCDHCTWTGHKPLKGPLTEAEIRSLPLEDRQFLEMKDAFLDVFAAMEATRQAAERQGRSIPPGSPMGRAHDALRLRMATVCGLSPEDRRKIGL